MDTMKIKIDEREHKLYEIMNELNEKKNELIIDSKVLQIGDIIIEEEEKEILIIERKTIEDLLASIKDGRYKEQSYRLIHTTNIPRHNIIYIIEGLISKQNPYNQQIIYSAITSLNLYEGFSIFRTNTIHETGEYIIKMVEKMKKNKKKGLMIYTIDSPINTKKEEEYCSVVKKTKKENITTNNIGILMLCQIPGISTKTATKLMENYSNFGEFVEKMKTDTSTTKTNEKIRTFLFAEGVDGSRAVLPPPTPPLKGA
jgi:ERCC4-type nuclease